MGKKERKGGGEKGERHYSGGEEEDGRILK